MECGYDSHCSIITVLFYDYTDLYTTYGFTVIRKSAVSLCYILMHLPNSVILSTLRVLKYPTDNCYPYVSGSLCVSLLLSTHVSAEFIRSHI